MKCSTCEILGHTCDACFERRAVELLQEKRALAASLAAKEAARDKLLVQAQKLWEDICSGPDKARLEEVKTELYELDVL